MTVETTVPSDQTTISTTAHSAAVAPVSKQERIFAMDALRGFAVLGILLMNIVDFGLPGNAYIDPSIAGGDRGPNLVSWFANQIFFEGKMRAIFSMLFGAGAILLLTRGEERDHSLRPADIYYRRTMWLILFGVLHAYLIWWGDILYPYGVIGLALFPLRKVKPKWLLTAGVILLLILTGFNMAQSFERVEKREKGLAAQKAAAASQPLTEEQQEAKKEWEDFLKEVKPGPKELAKQIDAHRGSYWSVLKWRAGKVAEFQSTGMYFFWIYDAGGMMLIGMGLLGLGVLTAQRSRRFYWTMVLLGYGVGGSLNALTGYRYWKSGFDPIEGIAGFELGYAIGRLLVALAHIGLLMLIIKSGWLNWLTARLASAGQMALSCYLATSVICSTFFYGYGFGMYAKLQRYQLLYVVFAVWIFLLIISPIWLSRFRFGPMEWVWRSLTYWKKQPMKLKAAESV